MQDFRNDNEYSGYAGILHAPADFPDADGNELKTFHSNILTNIVSNVSLYHVSADTSDKQQTAKRGLDTSPVTHHWQVARKSPRLRR